MRPVIFSKWSGIGDIICTFPAALELQKKHPRARFIYNCFSDFSSLPKLGGVADKITSFQEIGLVGYWYRFLLGGFYNFASDDDREGVTHSRVYIRDFGLPFGVDPGEEHPKITPRRDDQDRVMALLKGNGIVARHFVVIHTGPSWPVREWSTTSWEQLVQKLSDRGYKDILQIGTTQHSLTAGAGDVKLIAGTTSLVDKLSLEETIALISLADLFIGIDSGMLHIAAAVGTKSIGLWGATSAEFRFSPKNRKYHVVSSISCQGCHHRAIKMHWISGCPEDIHCMKVISVKTVYNIANHILKSCK